MMCLVARLVTVTPAEGRSNSRRALVTSCGACVSQKLVDSIMSRRPAAVAAVATSPARVMSRVLSSPWPGSGSNMTTASPAPNASKHVSPPAFWIRTSLAAISSGRRCVNPRIVADPSELTTFVHPTLSGVVISQPATHYSTLRLNEELLGLPLLGAAPTAPDIRQALGL